MKKRNKEIMDWTNNSSIYNKTRKRYLETGKGLIRCSYCRYHKGDNSREWYGGFIESGETFKTAKLRFPSWKLASNNRKQWMGKNHCKITIEQSRHYMKNTDWMFVTIEIGTRRKGIIKYSKL